MKNIKTQNKDKPTILLLDSHAILHRSYHAMPYMMSSHGIHSGAVFGFVKAILQAVRASDAKYCIACYDLGGATFRHLAYEDYKGHRKKTDNELVSQIEDSKNFCKALDIGVVSREGYEADDCIGSIVKKYKSDYNIVILTGDMDIMQIIDDSEGVKVLYLKTLKEEIFFDKNKVFEKYNIYPENIVDYKALVGDSSDNIKGVAGIGEKTAIKIIESFHNIDNLYDVLISEKEEDVNLRDEVLSKKVQEKLLLGKDDAYFSYELATIYKDLDIDLSELLSENNSWENNIIKDKNEYKSLCDKYELRSVRNAFDNKENIADDWEAYNNKSKEDIEDEIVMNINFDASDNEVVNNHDTKENILKVELEKDKNDIESENNYDIKTIKIFNALLHSEKSKADIEEIYNINKISKDKSRRDLENILEEKLKKENLYDYYINFEKPSLEIIDMIFKNGINIDKNELAKQQESVKAKIVILEKEIHDMAGEEFLISSPKQLSNILYDKLSLFSDNKKGVKKTSTGDRSTNAEMLDRLKDEHIIIPKIIFWRELSKIYNTYLLPLSNFIGEDSKIHPEFNQLGAATGRWSCENPNLQNLPANSDIGKMVRNIFVASSGYKLVSLDYSQIDLRSAAILSGDEKLLEIFNKDLDIHTAVAAKILNKKIQDITKEERSSAKAINFGILYGMGVRSLQDGIGGDRKTAQEFYDNYKKTFSTLMYYLESVKAEAKSYGFTETLFGRKREIPMLFSPIPFIRAQGERIAINAPVQGTSADIIKRGAIDVYNNLKDNILGGDIKLLLQIHDELVFEISDKDKSIFDNNIKVIKDTLENVLINNLDLAKNLKDKNNIIPLKVSVHIGDNLGDLK